jgi:hypothetical protein
MRSQGTLHDSAPRPSALPKRPQNAESLFIGNGKREDTLASGVAEKKKKKTIKMTA